MDIVSTRGGASRERTGGLRRVREGALRDHRRLVRALRAHDADGAERAMVDHLDHVERGLHAALDSERVGGAASTTTSSPAAGREVAGTVR
jgi:DNA-binding GntR family transcriptional regulator